MISRMGTTCVKCTKETIRCWYLHHLDPRKALGESRNRSPHTLSNRFHAKNLIYSYFIKCVVWTTYFSHMDSVQFHTSVRGATSHTRLKARDHFVLRSLIGQKGRNRPSSLHTRRWRSKCPKKLSWMKSLCGFLHGRLWFFFNSMSEFVLGPPPRGRHDAC